jgi:hypothetical protein
MRVQVLGLVVLMLGGACVQAQLASRDGKNATSSEVQSARRTRLILKDGTYQVVLRYKVVGARVTFVSAERAGEVEEIPLDLVDLDATKQWEQRHADPTVDPTVDANGDERRPVPAIDPEVLKEEADRRALSPEVAPDLRLVPEDSVLALDTFHAVPELVPLLQSSGDLNKETGHSILRAVLNPNASTHEVLELKGEKSPVQLHVNDPGFYLRMDDEAAPSGEVFSVETHGASSSEAVKEKRRTPSRYAIVRVDVRQGARVVASFHVTANGWAEGAPQRQEDVVDTTATLLPGGHWTKIVPTENLLFGEYCLIEILGENQVNLSVWDFGVHPTAPENRDVIRPEKRKGGLEKRPED